MIAADPLAPRVPVPDAPPVRWTDFALPVVTAAVHEAGHLVIADLVAIRVDAASIDPEGNGAVFADLDGADPRDVALFAAGGTAAQLVFGLGDVGGKVDAETACRLVGADGARLALAAARALLHRERAAVAAWASILLARRTVRLAGPWSAAST